VFPVISWAHSWAHCRKAHETGRNPGTDRCVSVETVPGSVPSRIVFSHSQARSGQLSGANPETREGPRQFLPERVTTPVLLTQVCGPFRQMRVLLGDVTAVCTASAAPSRTGCDPLEVFSEDDRRAQFRRAHRLQRAVDLRIFGGRATWPATKRAHHGIVPVITPCAGAGGSSSRIARREPCPLAPRGPWATHRVRPTEGSRVTGVEDGRARFAAVCRSGKRSLPDLLSFPPSHLDVRIPQAHSLRVPTNVRSAHVEYGGPTCRRLLGTRGASRHAFAGTPSVGSPSQP
jgi:hypothetical protein